MTTLTAEAQTTETQTALVRALNKFAPKLTKPELTDIQSDMAHAIHEKLADQTAGAKLTRKESYEVMKQCGVDIDAYKKFEKVNEDFCTATHAVVTDRAFGAIKDGAEEFKVDIKFGGNSNYLGTYRKENTKDVRNPSTGEVSQKTTYGEHGASIKTKYASLGKNRVAAQALAESLFKSE